MPAAPIGQLVKLLSKVYGMCILILVATPLHLVLRTYHHRYNYWNTSESPSFAFGGNPLTNLNGWGIPNSNTTLGIFYFGWLNEPNQYGGSEKWLSSPQNHFQQSRGPEAIRFTGGGWQNDSWHGYAAGHGIFHEAFHAEDGYQTRCSPSYHRVWNWGFLMAGCDGFVSINESGWSVNIAGLFVNSPQMERSGGYINLGSLIEYIIRLIRHGSSYTVELIIQVVVVAGISVRIVVDAEFSAS